MLLLLVALIILASLAVLFIKPKKSTLLLCLLTTSLGIFWFGIMTYIAKKGGIGSDTEFLLYGFPATRRFFQYLRLTLGELGFLVAVGRYLFPLFLLLLSLQWANFDAAVRMRHLPILSAIIPALSVIVSFPTLFELLTSGNEMMLHFLVNFCAIWIWAYLILSFLILAWEYHSITSPFFRHQFLEKSMVLVSLAVLYALYCKQDPAQIYLFYRSDYMWMLGLWYLSKGFSPAMYITVTICSLLSAIVGFVSIVRYARLKWDQEQERLTLEKKGKDASKGINIFIHGIKNGLLANRVVITRLSRQMEGASAESKESLRLLADNNQKMLDRMERLYQSSKHNILLLEPTDIGSILDSALEKCKEKYPAFACTLTYPMAGSPIVLADKEHLAEAFANILLNGWEATLSAGKDAPLYVSVINERLWVSVSLSDQGAGIPEKIAKQLYEPFVSSKNSANNWGMGMFYVRDVVQSHFGTIRYTTSKKGTTFVIYLPRYGKARHAEN